MDGHTYVDEKDPELFTNGEHDSPDNSLGSSSSVPSRSTTKSSKKRVSSSSHGLSNLMATVDDFSEFRDLRRKYKTMSEQYRTERERANTAEKHLLEVVQRLTDVNREKLVALRDVETLRQELNMYKIQLDATQKEVHKAQDVVRALDDQKLRVERECQELRRMLRKLKDDRIIRKAREDGHRIGFAEGMNQGRQYSPIEVTDTEFRDEYAWGGVPVQSAYPSAYDGDRRDIDDDESYSPPLRSRPRTPTRASSPRPFIPPPAPRQEPPPAAPAPPPPVVRQEPMPPVSTYNRTPSPFHPPTDIPPDNYIPVIQDGKPFLPPPHEMQPMPPTPDQPPTPSLPTVQPRERDPSPVPIPDPTRTPRTNYTAPKSARSSRHVRRQGSNSSMSTGFSQFELTKRRPEMDTMRSIPEAHSPRYAPPPQETMQTPRRPPVIVDEIDSPTQHRPPMSPMNQWRSGDTVPTPSSIRISPPLGDSNDRSDDNINISIEPPSSGNSPLEARPSDPLLTAERGHLSPADALHVQPLPQTEPPPQPTEPIVLQSHELPPGFQAIGFTPSQPGGGHLPGLNDGAPHGIPAAYSPMSPEDRMLHQPVIPSLETMNSGPPEPESDSESVSTRRSKGSSETLTTPPGRGSKARSIYSNATYAAGRPLPPSTAGSVSGRTERTDYTGARVPLPPSTPGSISGRTNWTAGDVPLPASTAGSVSGKTSRSARSRR